MSKDEAVIPHHDIPITVETVNEEQQSFPSNQLSFTATLSSSFIGDDLEDSTDDLTISKQTVSDKKKHRGVGKGSEESHRKRKDTANSITNFFHRFTRFDKEDKKIVEEEDQSDDEESIERPDKLISPESEEKWFESRETGNEGSDSGKDGVEYEWDPANMNETMVLEPLPHESNNAIFEEKGMLKLLDDFRNGEMRWLAEPQIGAMCRVKEAHEDITNTHLKIFEIEKQRRKRRETKDFFSDTDSEEEKNIEDLFEEINLNMVSMHSVLDTVPFYDASKIRNACDNQADDEYFSS